MPGRHNALNATAAVAIAADEGVSDKAIIKGIRVLRVLDGDLMCRAIFPYRGRGHPHR